MLFYFDLLYGRHLNLLITRRSLVRIQPPLPIKIKGLRLLRCKPFFILCTQCALRANEKNEGRTLVKKKGRSGVKTPAFYCQ